MANPALLEQVLYPCVRVTTGKAGGSGTLIYSKPVADGDATHETYVLTCHHVVEDAITVSEVWDPLLKRNVDKERRSTVRAEFFNYRAGGRAGRTETIDADIQTWGQRNDIAILKLRMDEPAKHVARLFPKERTKEITLFDRVRAVGCALLHPPIVTEGIITSMSDEIDDLSYWMSSAQIIFGNSGGAIFHENERGHEFIGIPSRVAVYGWGSAVTHLGYFSDIERIYRWLDEECYQFLYDPAFTSKQCAEMREAKRKRELEGYGKRVAEK